MNEVYYCSFEVAKLLKEKGFDWEIKSWYKEDGTVQHVAYYDDTVPVAKLLEVYPRPTQQMAMCWLRKKGYHVQVIYDHILEWAVEIVSLNETVEYDYEEQKIYHPEKQAGFNRYEDAAEVGIQYVLENLI